MTKQDITNIARFCYKPNSERDFSIQKFIEDTVLPEDCREYTIEEMESYIERFLKKPIGAKDYNGKEIFLGDIDVSDEPMYVVWDNKTLSYGLKFLNPCESSKNYIDTCIDWSGCIIDGNIEEDK